LKVLIQSTVDVDHRLYFRVHR